ncbi:MAG: outer membrane lipoprotein carrier protein LolA [Nitrospirae bacterium]|nr:outer membrane lipoprotein carrier protein LolA [Nitrospirota bacterium]
MDRRLMEALRVAIILTAFCLLIAAPAVAAPDAKFSLPAELTDSDAAVSPEDKTKLTRRIKDLLSGIDAVSAAVYQTKHLAMLKKAIESEGTVIIRKTPRSLRWEAVRPERTITIIDEKTITIYKPIEKEADIYGIDANIAAKQSMAFLSSTMWGDISELEKKFNTAIYLKNGLIIYRLIPISEMVTRYLTSIIIYFNESTGIPVGFELATPKGDKYMTSLKDVKNNPPLDIDTFYLKFPKEVWIRDHTKPDENNR